MGIERYEYIRAIIDCGSLRWEYKIKGRSVVGRMDHDEDVDNYSDEDIRQITRQVLNVSQADPVFISIEYC
jgi:hypothetical protein